MKKRRRPARAPRPPQEKGAIVKPGRGRIKVALVYPNTYKAGMSSLGYQTVYRLANQDDRVACERVFLPDTRKKPGRHEDLKIKSLETGLHLDQFDIILFSISFENDFLNLARIMRASGIPLRSSHRNHIHPLVAAGGVACFLNPEPIAPFMDLFLLGEAECLLASFFDHFEQIREDSGQKKRLLETVEATVQGSYVPGHHCPILYPGQDNDTDPCLDANPAKIRVRYIEDLIHTQTTTTVMTSGTAFKDTFLIETLKGCPHGCRFCTAGFVYRPPRVYPLQTILTAMDEAAEKTDKVGLVSSAILDHPDIKEICRYGWQKGLHLSFSSLRADKLDDEMISGLSGSISGGGRVKTATIAPEAGSQRMRNVINKKLNRNQILNAAESLVNKGVINLRLYFMIGLPFETRQDVQAIVDLALDIKAVFLKAARKKKKIGTITLSINPFIPKPSTPFQWVGMTAEPELKKRMDIIRQGLKKVPNLVLQFESLRQAKAHALLSLGDRNASRIIEQAMDLGWTRAMKMENQYCRQVIYNEKPTPVQNNGPAEPNHNGTGHAALPWQILEHPVSDAFLLKEYVRAKKEKPSMACPMISCKDCRICMKTM